MLVNTLRRIVVLAQNRWERLWTSVKPAQSLERQLMRAANTDELYIRLIEDR